jgi:phosphoglycerate-specific signal transduction histidine kinase
MAADGAIGADWVLRKGEAVASGLPLHELTEALTALGNYLASANKILNSAAPGSPRLGEALEKSLGQHERAVEATRRLRQLNRPRRKVEGDSLIGLR